jgi:hypothetical protein
VLEQEKPAVLSPCYSLQLTTATLNTPVNVLDRDRVPALERCQRLGGPVGHNVTADAVHVEFTADGRDLHTEVVRNLNRLELRARVNDALRQRTLQQQQQQ